jgi:hypothetical protein
VQFPNVRKASEAVIEILNTGIGIRAFVLPPSSFLSSITPLERLICFLAQNASNSSMQRSCVPP